MSESGVEYILQRDYLASARLNLQHTHLRQLFPNLLHSTIKAHLPPRGSKIADAGTGTGCWAFALADEMPDAQVAGFDIAADQFAHESTWPSNAKMRIWDFKTPPPDEFVGVFDAVNVGIIAVVVENDDPTSIIRNIALLLKPGGFLQWDEYVYTSAAVARLTPETKTPGLDGLANAFHYRLKISWISKLETIFEGNGFRTLEQIVKRERPWQRKMMTEIFMMGMKEVSETLRAEGLTSRADESDRDHDNVVKEVKEGNYMSIEFQRVVARKL